MVWEIGQALCWINTLQFKKEVSVDIFLGLWIDLLEVLGQTPPPRNQMAASLQYCTGAWRAEPAAKHNSSCKCRVFLQYSKRMYSSALYYVLFRRRRNLGMLGPWCCRALSRPWMVLGRRRNVLRFHTTFLEWNRRTSTHSCSPHGSERGIWRTWKLLKWNTIFNLANSEFHGEGERSCCSEIHFKEDLTCSHSRKEGKYATKNSFRSCKCLAGMLWFR